MPNSTLNPLPGAAALRTYLRSVLPDATLTDAPVDSAFQPLLLMLTKHVMAAFAFSNGDIRASYESLYGGFKTHYANQRGQWDALDLAFVFCVDPGVQNLDVFCSSDHRNCVSRTAHGRWIGVGDLFLADPTGLGPVGGRVLVSALGRARLVGSEHYGPA